MSEHDLWIFHRIKGSQSPLQVWVNVSSGLCCAGDSYPSGVDFIPVGTFDARITEREFSEDLAWSRHSVRASA